MNSLSGAEAAISLFSAILGNGHERQAYHARSGITVRQLNVCAVADPVFDMTKSLLCSG